MGNRIIPHDRGNSQPHSFEFDGHLVTIKYDSQNDPWFNGPEVCRAISVTNPSMAYARLDDDERTTLSQIEGESTQSGKSPVYVSESGLYNLLLRSDKPEAKAFKKLITSEILPSIRKTGSYSFQTATPAEIILMQAQKLVDLERTQEQQRREMLELYEKQAEQAGHIESIVERIDNAEYFTIRHWCKSQGIRVSTSVMQMWGRTASAISRGRGVEIGSITEGNYPVNTYHKSVLSEVCVAKPRSTPGQLHLPRTSGGK